MIKSAHPREGGDPVLWMIGGNRFAPAVVQRPVVEVQAWVPAFAGMSGFGGSLSRNHRADEAFPNHRNAPSAATTPEAKLA